MADFGPEKPKFPDNYPLVEFPGAYAARDTEDKISSGEETTFETAPVGFHHRDLEGRIKRDNQYLFAGGGNSNIYRGKLTRSDGRKIRVAIKVIRMSDDALASKKKCYGRLKDKNILPIIGVCEDLAPLPVLISPFYKFGHIGKHLSKNPRANREELTPGVASGLEHPHNNNATHGDLKQNVLMDKHGVPCICDFGISKIVSRRGFTTLNVGTAPYMAPDLFFVIDAANMSWLGASVPNTTTSSDVYSFALLVLEILTGEPPEARPTRLIVSAKIIADLRPKQVDYPETKPPLRPSISDDAVQDAVSFATRTIY
ncbi:kinase-like domain-containing protein [Mycena sanguinolenta]|nr:kinase-like domain-containing protein [Mycena sanguinolenta]